MDAIKFAEKFTEHSQNIDPALIGKDFCKIWSEAGPALKLVAGVVTLIPGAGATAGVALQALIKLGDDASAQICKP